MKRVFFMNYTINYMSLILISFCLYEIRFSVKETDSLPGKDFFGWDFVFLFKY